MEIKLSGSNCREFSIHSHFTVSMEVDDQIQKLMRETRHQSHDNPLGESAFYGSEFTMGNTKLTAVGMLGRIEEESRYLLSVICTTVDDALPSRPDTVKPISDLLKMGDNLFGEISMDCEVMFTYELSDRVRSRVSVPVPLLLVDQGSDHGLTHIDSVTLSHRDNDRSTHTVTVDSIDSGKSIMHSVNFTTSSVLTSDSIRQIFEVADRMSKSLIDQHN